MNRTFGPAAGRLAGLAARVLGWKPDEFWRATPAELATSLNPPETGPGPLDRAALDRMMERDNDRSG